MFLNPRLPNAWPQNVISSSQVTPAAEPASCDAPLILALRAGGKGRVKCHGRRPLASVSIHHTVPGYSLKGLEPGACPSFSLPLDLGGPLQHCALGKEISLQLRFLRDLELMVPNNSRSLFPLHLK